MTNQDPKLLAFHFMWTHPDAAIEDAMAFAKRYLMKSPFAAADFVIDWLRLRDRLIAAKVVTSSQQGASGGPLV